MVDMNARVHVAFERDLVPARRPLGPNSVAVAEMGQLVDAASICLDREQLRVLANLRLVDQQSVRSGEGSRGERHRQSKRWKTHGGREDQTPTHDSSPTPVVAKPAVQATPTMLAVPCIPVKAGSIDRRSSLPSYPGFLSVVASFGG